MVKVIGPLASHHASGRMSAPRVYSSSLRNRKDRKAPEGGAPPSHDYEVTGTITPATALGYYDHAGTHNALPYYKHTTNTWYLWFQFNPIPALFLWEITATLGSTAGPYWDKWTPAYSTPEGDYDPYHGATGTATVVKL